MVHLKGDETRHQVDLKRDIKRYTTRKNKNRSVETSRVDADLPILKKKIKKGKKEDPQSTTVRKQRVRSKKKKPNKNKSRKKSKRTPSTNIHIKGKKPSFSGLSDFVKKITDKMKFKKKKKD